jgi:antitoxin ChpS
METILRRYGHSNVAVLPPAVLKDLRLSAGQSLTLTADNGKIVLTSVSLNTRWRI